MAALFPEIEDTPSLQLSWDIAAINFIQNFILICKYLSDNFLTQNGLKLGDALLPLFFNFALEYVLILVSRILLRLYLTKITTQLPLFATYRVFTVHNIIPHYMFRLYGHPQVYHVYKNAKIIIIT
jgi:hypothetical protein